jgi:hypothetical protein
MLQGVTLLLEQPDPAILQPVIDEGDPVAIARRHGHGHLVHIRVDALEQVCCTMQGFGRKGIVVVLANNAGLAMQQQWHVAVHEQTNGQLAAYGVLQGLFANVS